MNGNFIKLKKAAVRYALLFSVLTGLGIGILTSAVIMIFTKLFSAWDPMFLLIGAGAAVACTAVLFLIFRPTEKRFAKKLDADFSLDERVATSIEFKDREGDVLELQRADTEQRLGAVSPSKLRPKKLIAAILILAMSLGAISGALILPPAEMQEVTEDPIDEFDKQWILAAITELIAMVENAYMDDGLRATVLGELRGLSDFVEQSAYLSEMKTSAILAVKAVNSALKLSNSARVIGEKAAGGFGEAVTEIGDALNKLSGVSVKKALKNAATALAGASEEDISHAADELNALITTSGVRIDDPVVIIFKNLIAETHAAAATSASLDAAYENAATQLSPILILQSVNDTIVMKVIDKLCELFGITQADLTTPDGEIEVDIREPGAVTPGEGDEEEEDNEDETISGGGLGTGDTIYGSDDVIFDPNTGTYAPYGDILQRYFDSFTEQKLDGKISTDFIEKLDDYFGALYGGTDEE